MLFRKPEIKILSHPNISKLNHLFRAQFLKFFFDELRAFLIPTKNYPDYDFIFSTNSSLLLHIKNFWVTLSSCSLTLDSDENIKCYAAAEKNIFIIYHGLYEFRKKFMITMIEKLFHALDLVIEECYPSQKISDILFFLPIKYLNDNQKNFMPLKKLIEHPIEEVEVYENHACKKALADIFFLYQKSDVSDKNTELLRKDIFLIKHKHPIADHDNILEGFLRRNHIHSI